MLLKMNGKIKSMLNVRKLQSIILVSLIILIVIILCIFVSGFATIHNILNILIQVAPIGIMAFGITFVMITGGIDISGPAVMTTAAVIGADYMIRTGDLFFGPFLMLLVGSFMGAINGFAVTILRMVPLVVTLSMMTINMGVAMAWTMGESVAGLSPQFAVIFSRSKIIVMFIMIAVVFSFILRKTIYGRWLYYIGNNVNTARVSGIPTVLAIFMTYVISGLCAGIAGIINTSNLLSVEETRLIFILAGRKIVSIVSSED
jgi:ribose/xylose/arabinose/galactoside ABC-type transport system permease subunit